MSAAIINVDPVGLDVPQSVVDVCRSILLL